MKQKLQKTKTGDERFEIIASGATYKDGIFCFSSVSESESFMMKIRAKIEFDGFCDYKIALIAKRDAKLSDVNLCLPISEYSRKYFMGLGECKDNFKETLDFKWNSEKTKTDSGLATQMPVSVLNLKTKITRSPYLATSTPTSPSLCRNLGKTADVGEYASMVKIS